jgi:acyl carrier protein
MDIDPKFDEKILRLIAEVVPGKFKKAKIMRDMDLHKDLGLDSLTLLSLLFRMEEAFGIDLRDLDFEINMDQMRTVDDAINMSRHIVQQVTDEN